MIETVPSGTILYGRYRIERVLGSGGFGHVYLAIDLTTNQQYAVKEYLVSGSGGQEQLQHEATVLSHLHHPNLPAFKDAFIEQGRYYIVLDYIEGSDLTDLVRLTRQRNDVIPMPRILNWVLSICDAIMFMHSQHPTIIHRDIKPDNIRITSNGTAVLVDLGNAKAAADGARTLFFIRHQGTPGYAPPEQYPGGSGTDARSDVYALGGTLYFALTASEPPSVSTRNQSIQQGHADLPSLFDHLTNNPAEESPEAHAARQFRLGVSKPAKPVPRHSRHIAQLAVVPPALLSQLNQVIQKAMALKPRNRYQFVADFANDLKNVIASLPAPPTPPSTRRVDPYGTQPDLPGLYEAIQDAQGKAHPDTPDPGTQPMTPENSCPNCHTPLAKQASFCPRCGIALAKSANTSAASNAVPAQTYAHSIDKEKTVVVTPAQVQQAAAHYTATKPQKSSTSTVIPAIADQTTAPPAQVQMSANGATPPISTWQNNGSAQSHPGGMPSTTRVKIDPKILLLILVGIIIILLILAFILFNQHIHAAAYLHTLL
jgi:serine/threonine protein kinase